MTAENKSVIKKAFGTAFPHTIPVFTGFITLGMAYGVLMSTKGFGTIWAMLMSLVAFCGSMQFAAITLLVSAFDPIQAFILSVMVNARHLFYGISMLEKYKGLGKIRFFLIYMLCDETFSIASSIEPPEDVNRKWFYFAISILDYSYWQMGTLLGSIVGNVITFNTEGLDFALTALFVVLFLEQIKKTENRLSGVIGVCGTIAALIVFGADNLVIPAMIIVLICLLAGRRKIC